MSSILILLTQFVALFLTLLAVNFKLNFVNEIISIIGSSLLLLTISWHLTKYVNNFINSILKTVNSNKKAVLITGCDTGFGNHLAFKLNSKRFMVYATVLSEQSDGSVKLVTDCEFPDLMKVIKMDVTSDDDVNTVYELVCNDLNKNDRHLWGLVNNAGIISFGAIDWGNMDTYKRVFEVNVFGLVRVTRSFLPLIRQSKGRIVNISSLAGKVTFPYMSIYSMTKHAVNSFSDALRREMQNFGINVSIVMPCSGFNTNIINDSLVSQMTDNLWYNTTDNSVKQFYGQQNFVDIKKFIMSLLSSNSDNLDLVSDAITNALVSNSPSIRYEITTDWTSYLINLLLDSTPNEIIDKSLMSLMTKI